MSSFTDRGLQEIGRELEDGMVLIARAHQGAGTARQYRPGRAVHPAKCPMQHSIRTRHLPLIGMVGRSRSSPHLCASASTYSPIGLPRPFASMRSITACSSSGAWTANISRTTSRSSLRYSNRTGLRARSGRNSRCRRRANSGVSPSPPRCWACCPCRWAGVAGMLNANRRSPYGHTIPAELTLVRNRTAPSLGSQGSTGR